MTDNKNIDRRTFLKRLGAGAAVSSLALAGCDSAKKSASGNSSESLITGGEMTYRTNPKTGEKVSIHGYGCMRWPTVKSNQSERGH